MAIRSGLFAAGALALILGGALALGSTYVRSRRTAQECMGYAGGSCVLGGALLLLAVSSWA